MGLVGFPMLDKDVVPVGPRVACFDHPTVSGRIDGRAGRGRIIGAPMGSLGFVDRMEAIWVEIRADPGEVQRRF